MTGVEKEVQRESCQRHQLKWHFSISDEVLSMMKMLFFLVSSDAASAKVPVLLEVSPWVAQLHSNFAGWELQACDKFRSRL